MYISGMRYSFHLDHWGRCGEHLHLHCPRKKRVTLGLTPLLWCNLVTPLVIPLLSGVTVVTPLLSGVTEGGVTSTQNRAVNAKKN